MAASISEINNTVVRKWVFLVGMSGCFDRQTDKISPAFYRTLSLWDRYPAYNLKIWDKKKSRARVLLTIYRPWSTG